MVVIDTAELYSAYLGAIRDGDRRRAFQVIDDARDAGLALGTIDLDVLQPALREIGHLWQANRTLIAACVDTERHEVGLRMLCDLLDREGWHTTYLGATVPVESLVAMVQRGRPTVVALSTALSPHLRVHPVR